MGDKIPRDDLLHKTVVHILNNTVDGIGQFIRFIEAAQMPEIMTISKARQRMLDVFRNGRVNIPPGVFVIPEGGIICGSNNGNVYNQIEDDYWLDDDGEDEE